jgi:hypothetical protein
MSRTKLGEQYVRFAVDGLPQAEAEVTATSKKIESTWSTMRQRLKAGIASIGEGLGKLGKEFLKVGAATGIFTGLFIRGAMQGSREAEMLDTAFARLTKTVGDIFAPVVRIAAGAIENLAQWFNGLSDTTKGWVQVITLVGVGIGGLGAAITLLGSVFGGLAVVAGVAWAVVTSPIMLAVAAIAILVGAIGTLVDYFMGGSKNMADSGNNATKSWVGNMLNGIKILAQAVGNFINWYSKKSAEASDWIAKKLSAGMEALGMVPKGTTKLLGEMDPIKPFAVDIDAMTGAMDAFNNQVDKAVPRWKDIKNFAGDLPKKFKNLMDGLGGGNMKFNIKFDAGFESLQQSWERIQSADFNVQEELKNVAKDQLKVLGDMKDVLGGIFDNTKDLFAGGMAAVGD